MIDTHVHQSFTPVMLYTIIIIVVGLVVAIWLVVVTVSQIISRTPLFQTFSMHA